MRLVQGLLGFGMLSVVAGVAVVSLHLHKQLIYIPKNIQTIPTDQNTFRRHQNLRQKALSVVEQMHSNSRQDNGSVSISLSTQDLNAFFASTLAQQIERKGAQQILLGTQVERVGGRLRTTALLNLSKVSVAKLQGSNRLALLRRFLKVPGIRNRTVAVIAEGKPVVQNRSLTLQEPIIRIGRLTISEPTQWLGVSHNILQESFNRELKYLPIDLKAAQIIKSSATPQIELRGELTAW